MLVLLVAKWFKAVLLLKLELSTARHLMRVPDLMSINPGDKRKAHPGAQHAPLVGSVSDQGVQGSVVAGEFELLQMIWEW